jgi:hypothetical protein
VLHGEAQYFEDVTALDAPRAKHKPGGNQKGLDISDARSSAFADVCQSRVDIRFVPIAAGGGNREQPFAKHGRSGKWPFVMRWRYFRLNFRNAA